MHQHSRRNLFAAMLAFAGMVLFACSAGRAVTPAVLIGPDLQPREVKLQALSAGSMSFFDAERTMQVESTAKVLQIRFEAEAEKDDAKKSDTTVKPKAALAFVEFIDGQRIVGAFLGADGEGQKLRLRHAALGDITVNLDKVSRLTFDGSTPANPQAASDTVQLVNGDSVTGFVVAVKDAGIDVQQGNAKPFTLPRDRVRGLLLANPVNRAAGKQHMAWLRDGSRLLASEVTISADKLTLASPLAGAPVTVLLPLVARIELASSQGRLIDLADLPMSVVDGGKVFGLPMPPRIQEQLIRLHAPVTVSFALPEKAARFAALAELDAADEDARLAAFSVFVRAAGETVAVHAISAAQPRAAINAAITGATLTITLDPAANGPVLDRLRLRDAVVFIAGQ